VARLGSLLNTRYRRRAAAPNQLLRCTDAVVPMRDESARWTKPEFRFSHEEAEAVLDAMLPLLDQAQASTALAATQDAAAWYLAELVGGANTRAQPTKQERVRLDSEMGELLEATGPIAEEMVGSELRLLITSFSIEMSPGLWEDAIFSEDDIRRLPGTSELLRERLQAARPAVAMMESPGGGPRPLWAERSAVWRLGPIWHEFTGRGTSRQNRDEQDSGPFHRYVRASLSPVRSSMDPPEVLPELGGVVREWHDRRRARSLAHAELFGPKTS